MHMNSPVSSYLSSEEIILIRSSCIVSSEESKHRQNFVFWGKVFGIQNDYFIVQSNILNPYELPQTHYSRDGRSWLLLPAVQDHLVRSNSSMTGIFTGDPMASYSYYQYEKYGSYLAEPLLIQLKEEDRLAYLVRAVDSEGTILPKKSYIIDPSGHLIPDHTYKGMSYENCCDFENYETFVPLKKTPTQTQKDSRTRPLKLLQPLLTAFPENSTDRAAWRFQDKIFENYVVLNNINWPGLCFYHEIDGSTFGRFYFGRGCKEINMPFILGTMEDDNVAVDLDFRILPDYDFRRTPEEAERAAIALADAQAKKDVEAAALQEFLVSEGERIGSANELSEEMDLSGDQTKSNEGDATSDQDATSAENTSGDVSATEPDNSDLESVN